MLEMVDMIWLKGSKRFVTNLHTTKSERTRFPASIYPGLTHLSVSRAITCRLLPDIHIMDTMITTAEPIARRPFCSALAFLQFFKRTNAVLRQVTGFDIFDACSCNIIKFFNQKVETWCILCSKFRPFTPVRANRKNGLAQGFWLNKFSRPLEKPSKSLVRVDSRFLHV